MRVIPLTKGKFAVVDEADYANVSRWNWCTLIVHHPRRGPPRDIYYAMRKPSVEEQQRTGKRGPVLLHRYLMQAKADEEIDHENGDGLDNRRQNLRKASRAENGRNSGARLGSSKFKGVSRSQDRWRAYIKVNYKFRHLGYFDIEEEAARAYDQAARELHGKFACVNFPINGERSALL